MTFTLCTDTVELSDDPKPDKDELTFCLIAEICKDIS